jgi:uncharacterized membrane protein YbhN (UPF0104 family)
MQSRLGSFIEACANTAIGWSINFGANLVVLPAFGYPVTVAHALGIGVVFTVISVARSYVVRRWFNARIVRFARRMAG